MLPINMTATTRRLTLSALFTAIAVLLPILFHGIGLGAVFLPMFWPVAASVFFLPLSFACCIAVLAPFVSMLLTGMPPVPIIYIVLAQLFILALVTGYCRKKAQWGVFWPLLCGVIASQIAHFIAIIPLANILGLPSWLAAFPLLLKGVPGLALILIIVPAALSRIKHRSV